MPVYSAAIWTAYCCRVCYKMVQKFSDILEDERSRTKWDEPRTVRRKDGAKWGSSRYHGYSSQASHRRLGSCHPIHPTPQRVGRECRQSGSVRRESTGLPAASELEVQWRQ